VARRLLSPSPFNLACMYKVLGHDSLFLHELLFTRLGGRGLIGTVCQFSIYTFVGRNRPNVLSSGLCKPVALIARLLLIYVVHSAFVLFFGGGFLSSDSRRAYAPHLVACATECLFSWTCRAATLGGSHGQSLLLVIPWFGIL
jgi:hypothetical protein